MPAKTEQEFRNSFDTSIAAVDSTIDTTKGPLPFGIRNPVSRLLAYTDARVDRLNSLYSLSFIQNATDAELAAVANNYAVVLGSGRAATGRAILFTRTRPIEDCSAPTGTIVATVNSKFKFRTVEDAYLDASNADVYYDASRRWWFVSVKIEAIGVGEAFELPSDRIRKIISEVVGFEGVTNPTRLRRGAANPTRELIFSNIQNSLVAGKDMGTAGGQRALVLNQIMDTLVVGSSEAGTILNGVSLVFPSDGLAFPRSSTGPAIDVVCLLTSAAYQDDGDDTFVVSSTNQRTFTLSKVPAKSIVSVRKNGALLTSTLYSLSKDITTASGNSGRANDRLVLDPSVSTAVDDTIEVQYEYNAVISDLQAQETTSNNLFGTDVLYREPVQVSVEVVLEVIPYVTASLDENARDTIYAAVYTFFQYALGVTFKPEELRALVVDSLPFSAIVRILKFRKVNNSAADVESISLAKNQTVSLVFDSDKDIIVRR